MKLYTIFLILFLILSIKTKSILDLYSIEAFKDTLKRNGVFKIIESIKETYGQDLAIISCEELNKNCKGNCKKLVTEYMSPYVHQGPNLHSDGLPKQEEEDLKCINKLYYSQIIEKPFSNSVIKRKLRIIFNKNQANLIYNKIIKRVRDLGPCKK